MGLDRSLPRVCESTLNGLGNRGFLFFIFSYFLCWVVLCEVVVVLGCVDILCVKSFIVNGRKCLVNPFSMFFFFQGVC